MVSGAVSHQPGQDRALALALKRDLGVSYPTAWLMHHKLMQAMVEREAGSVLWGTVQADDAYLGRELNDGTPGRGSENMVPFLAAVSLDDDGHPQGDRRLGRRNLSPASTVISDGCGSFETTACAQQFGS